MTSVIIEDCLQLQSVNLVYFYCSYQDVQRKSFVAVARALLSQLLTQNEDLLPYLYEKRVSSGQVSLVSSELCAELLKTCLKTMLKTYIIIDGIDECELPERKTILSFFAPLVEGDDCPGRIRALFVSQDLNDIRKLLRVATTLRLTDVHNKADIESYAANWALKIQVKFSLPDVTMEHIKTAVCEGSEGKKAI